MSSGDRFPFALAKRLARVADEAILGVALSCIAAAVHSLVNFIRCSSALKKIRDAPSVDAAGLRSLLNQQYDEFSDGEEVLVVFRGTVSALTVTEENWIKSAAAEFTHWVADKMAAEEGFVKSAIKRWDELDMDLEGSFDKFMNGHWIKRATERLWINPPVECLLRSRSRLYGVVVQNTRSFIYKGIFSTKAWIEKHSSTRLVAVLDEEKMLFPDKEITAVGVCSWTDDGIPEMKSCSDLPYFLSEMSKDEMITVMTGDVKARMGFSIVVGFVSIALLGYAIARYWRRWKKRRLQRAKEKKRWKRAMRRREKALEREKGEARVEELCVVCLTKRRQSAFVPCGHLLCCRSCAALVKGKRNPQCPICRQSLQSLLNVYAS